MAHIQPGKTEDICKIFKLIKGQGEEGRGRKRRKGES